MIVLEKYLESIHHWTDRAKHGQWFSWATAEEGTLEAVAVSQFQTCREIQRLYWMMFHPEVKDAYRSLTWVVTHLWRGFLRISQDTFKNNSLDSWGADTGLHQAGLQGKIEGWCTGLLLRMRYFNYTHRHRGHKLQSWDWSWEAIWFLSCIPKSTTVWEWQTTGVWQRKPEEREAVVLHHIAFAFPHCTTIFALYFFMTY